MYRLAKKIALICALVLAGLAAGCQPEGKECHCTQTSCNCPLPPPKPSASDNGKNTDTNTQIAKSSAKARHRVHMARHGGKHVHMAMARSSRYAHAATRKREAFRHAPEAFHEGHERYMERREARRETNHWAGGHHGAREAVRYHTREARESRGWQSRSRAYRPLPYNYESRSRRYATGEWAYAERRRERTAVRESERYHRFSGREATRPVTDDMHRDEREVTGSYRDYEGAQELEAPLSSYSGGAAGYWTMSINTPEALDSWHGYGVDCPDWGG